MKCKACGEKLISGTSLEGTQPGEHGGYWYCFDCWNEVAKGVVNVQHMHGARLYSASNPGQPEPDPSQENTVRIMEDGS